MKGTREAILAAYRHEKPAFIANPNQYIKGAVMPVDRYFGPDKEGYDSFGVRWTNLGPDPALDGSMPTPGYRVLADITKWREQVKFPDLDTIPLKEIFEGMTQGIDRESEVVRGLLLSGLFERLNQLMGMEDALCAFYEEPEAVKDFFYAMADYKVKCIDLMVDAFRPDVIEMHDDWGMSTNMMFSPEIWREFIKPHEKRFADHLHANGVIYEHHSCGYIMPIIGDLVEIGVDAVNPINVCNDVDLIKREYGDRLTLVGAINNQLIDHPDALEDDIRAEARRVIDTYGPGGSYIPSGLFTKKRTVDIFYDEVIRFGAKAGR